MPPRKLRLRRRTPKLSSDKILDRLTRLHPKIIDLSLDRVERLLARLGDPHKMLPPVVHVAGTNGKGSVVAFLRAFLEAAGYRTHVYTSPHLVKFNERIRLAGTIIDDQSLADLLEECEEAQSDEPITFFEITTAAAFLAFVRAPADVVLLETGLGGRLDATSVVEKPVLNVLTPVSIDHQQFLGDTIEEIAFEKAGILRPGVPCVSAAQTPPAARVIAEQAAAVGSPLVREGVDWFVRGEGASLSFEDRSGARKLPLPALAGSHQIRNGGLAVACIDYLHGFTVPDAAVARGFETVEWPARLQRLTRGPLAEGLPAGWELWLDGGHNAAAGEMLAEQARNWRDRPLHLIFGMLNSKDPRDFLAPLAQSAGRLRTVTIPGESASLLAAETAAVGMTLIADAAPAVGVNEALEAIVAAETGPARVLICGSLYLAGRVLADNG